MPAVKELSHRSTILLDPNSPQSQSTVTTTMSTSGGQVDKGALPGAGTQGPSPGSNGDSNGASGQGKNIPSAQNDGGTNHGRDPNGRGGNLSPTQIGSTYPQSYSTHSISAQQPGYYHLAYNSQMTPESPSPAGPGGNMYADVGSFFQQPGAFHNTNPFPGAQQIINPNQQQAQAPPSPSQSHAGSIPPASPLFPRITGQATAGLLDQHRMLDGGIQARGAPLSPGPPYLNSALGNSGGWGDRNQQLAYQQHSPQMSAQGIPIPYVPGMPPRGGSAAGRSYSFEESMLPPSAMDQQNHLQHDQHSAGYSPYGMTNQNSALGAGGAATLFNQQWGYGGPPPDMYSTSGSPLQPRTSQPMGAYPGVGGAPPRHMQHPSHMQAYGGQFYPATSPGPPIQTTASNKGPDGANLFIFHIPNHFTNLDMYQLFCPYGNLLSVRIMVEKDTGRSRGFGFVSYDSPEAAALAIKELNGFAIGNKRLKVQHKQIRPGDNDRNSIHDDYGMGGFSQMPSSLPPSGPMAAMSNSAWYNNNSRAQTQYHAGGGGMREAVDGSGQPHELQVPREDGAVVGNTVGTADGGDGTDPSRSPMPSPLSNLDPLRQALPDVSGNGD